MAAVVVAFGLLFGLLSAQPIASGLRPASSTLKTAMHHHQHPFEEWSCLPSSGLCNSTSSGRLTPFCDPGVRSSRNNARKPTVRVELDVASWIGQEMNLGQYVCPLSRRLLMASSSPATDADVCATATPLASVPAKARHNQKAVLVSLEARRQSNAHFLMSADCSRTGRGL